MCEDCDRKITIAQALDAERKREARLAAIGVPSAYFALKSLAQYEPMTRSQEHALAAAQSWALGRSLPFLFLSGPVGTGKTHLAAAALVRRLTILARVNTCVATAYFVTFDDLVRRLQGTFKNDAVTSEDSLLREYVEAELLVVDDIAVKTPTSYATGILFALINGRYESRRPTIITTNKTISELGVAIATKEEIIQAQRILSRLVDREITVGIAVDGPDHRRTK